MAVRIEPGSTMETADAERLQLQSQRIRHGLESVLRRGVGREERQRAPAGDRAHEDDPALRAAQRRQEGLRHRDLPDEIDLELVAELVDRDELERRARARSPRC